MLLVGLTGVLFNTPAIAATDVVVKQLRLTPAQFSRATGLTVEPLLSGVLQEQVDHFKYRWFINGEEDIFEVSSSYPENRFYRGNHVRIEVTPVTLGGDSLPAFVSPLLTVGNSSPKIISLPEPVLSGSVVKYQAVATDADGDKVEFRLVSPQPGISLDEQTGLFVCDLSNYQDGNSITAEIVAEDNYGGKDSQSINMSLSFVEGKVTP